MTKFQFDSAREAEAARAFLVTVAVGRERHFDAGEELTELVSSDNLEPVGLIQARRDKPDPATYHYKVLVAEPESVDRLFNTLTGKQVPIKKREHSFISSNSTLIFN